MYVDPNRKTYINCWSFKKNSISNFCYYPGLFINELVSINEIFVHAHYEKYVFFYFRKLREITKYIYREWQHLRKIVL